MKRTQKQIDAEIETLRNMKPNVRRFSMFHDDHHKAISMQILVLTKNLDTDDISDFEHDDYDAAIAAIDWRDGESEGAPSEEWKDLLIKD